VHELLEMLPEDLDAWIASQDTESTNWEAARYLLAWRIKTETSLSSVLMLLKAADAAAQRVGAFHSDADRFGLRAEVIRRFGPDRNNAFQSPGSIVEWFAQLTDGLNPPRAPIAAEWGNLELVRRLRSIRNAVNILSALREWLTPSERSLVDPWVNSIGLLP
jgi:hypothetical protein